MEWSPTTPRVRVDGAAEAVYARVPLHAASSAVKMMLRIEVLLGLSERVSTSHHSKDAWLQPNRRNNEQVPLNQKNPSRDNLGRCSHSRSVHVTAINKTSIRWLTRCAGGTRAVAHRSRNGSRRVGCIQMPAKRKENDECNVETGCSRPLVLLRSGSPRCPRKLRPWVRLMASGPQAKLKPFSKCTAGIGSTGTTGTITAITAMDRACTSTLGPDTGTIVDITIIGESRL
jgi:hypothetical protein